MTTKLLEETPAKPCSPIFVKHRSDLAKKDLGKFITPSDIEGNDDWEVIGKNHSKLICCSN